MFFQTGADGGGAEFGGEQEEEAAADGPPAAEQMHTVRLEKGAGGIGCKVDRRNAVVGLSPGGAALCGKQGPFGRPASSRHTYTRLTSTRTTATRTTAIPTGAAEKAGLRQGDVVWAVDGKDLAPGERLAVRLGSDGAHSDPDP